MHITPDTVTDAHIRHIIAVSTQHVISTEDVELVLVNERRSIRSTIGVVFGESELLPCHRWDVQDIEVHGASEDIIKLDHTTRNQKLIVIQTTGRIRTGFGDEAVHFHLSEGEDGIVADITRISGVTDACACDRIASPVQTLTSRTTIPQAIWHDRSHRLHQLLDLGRRLIEV